MGHPDLLTTGAKFLGECNEQIMSNYDSILWPAKARVGVSSPGNLLYSKKNLGKMFAFIPSKDEDMFEVAEAMPIWSKDQFMGIKKNGGSLQCNWSNLMKRMKTKKKSR